MAEPLTRFLHSLNATGVEYAVVGGHAVGFHGVPTADALERAVPGMLFGEPTRFLAKPDLIANKRATGRPRDAMDADALDAEK